MIFSFSVPENEKNHLLIDWYKTVDAQERSRKFREIFMSYLKKPQHTMEISETDHVSRSINSIVLDRMDTIGSHSVEDDLDSRLDLIGIGGE